ncbi:MAG: peptidase S41, partial [Prevotella salivae]|nr:peptidase S41 [Segatella salivae]
ANLKYIDVNRKQLKKQFATFNDFNARFEVPQSLIDDVVQAAEKDKIKPKDQQELQATLPQLRRQLKALIARDLWDMSEYFQVINETNPIVVKAVRLLK